MSYAADAVQLTGTADDEIESLAAELVADHALDSLEIMFDQQSVTPKHVVISPDDGGGSTDVLQLVIPFTGHPGLLHCVPSAAPAEPFHGEVEKRHVLLEFLVSEDAPAIKRKMEHRKANLAEWAEAINKDLAASRGRLRQAALERLKSRARNAQRSTQLIDALEIPVTSVPAERALNFPIEPKSIRLPKVDQAGSLAWTLADETYEREYLPAS